MPERYTFWLAINNLGRHCYMHEEGEEPDARLARQILSQSGARIVFVLALQVAEKDRVELLSDESSES